MTEIAVVLKSLDDGQRFMEISRPTAQLQEGDYIVVGSRKYYIELPDTDSNYRLYRSHKFTVDNFIEVLAQGRTHLLITTNQLIKIPLTC
jgi:hypothetical protein